MWISRQTSNHMVPKDHVKGLLKRGLVCSEGCELAESSDGSTWNDTSATIIWETDTLQEYHKVIDPANSTQVINDPNYALKAVPPNV